MEWLYLVAATWIIVLQVGFLMRSKPKKTPVFMHKENRDA